MFLIRDFFATSSLKIVNSIAQWGSKNGRDIYVTRPNNPSTRVTNANSLFEWFGRAVIAFPAQKKDPPMRKGLWKPREADITGGKYLWMGKAARLFIPWRGVFDVRRETPDDLFEN